MQVDTRLIVYIHDGGSCIGCLLDVVLWMYNHQMYVHRLAAGFADGLDNRETERNVGDEYTVHDIHVQPVCLALVDHLNFLVQMEKVGREQ